MASALLLAYPTINNTDFLTQAPALPTTEKTVTWEAAGDPTSSPVTETTACWSDDGGTTTYNSLYAMMNAQTGDVTFNMPQGEFICTTEVSNETAYSFAFVGHASGTFVQQSNGGTATFKLNSATTTANLHLKDITAGAFDADIAAHNFGVDPITNLLVGSYGVFLSRGGSVYLDNFTVRFTGDDGIGAGTAYETISGGSGIRDNSTIMGYNVEAYGCGNQNTEHNIYIHGVPTYFYRLWSHDCYLGHALKYDGEMLVLNEPRLENDVDGTYGFDAAESLNVSWPSDLRVKGGYIYTLVDSADKQVISLASRRNAGGRGYSKRVPPWWEQSQVANQSRDLQWKNGGVGTTNDFYAGRVSAYSAGTPSITIKNQTQFTGTLDTVTNTTTSNYWRIDWGGETKLATKGDGTLVFTLESAFTGTPAANEPLVIYPASAGQDVPYLNEKMWNPNHASYYWDTVISGGVLDLTAYSNYPLHLFEDTMIVQDIDTITDGRVFDWISHIAAVYVANSPKLVDLPMAPMSGESSTNTWSDAAYGSLDFGDAQNIFSGDEATTPIAVMPLLTGLAGCPLILENGTTTQNGRVATDADNIDTFTGAPLDPTVKYVEGGTVNSATSLSSSTWWPTTADTTTSATASVDATTLTVSSITGFSDGQKILVEYATPAAGVSPVYVGNVSGAPSGSTITITPALSRAVASGARVAAVSDQGTLPTWFLDIPTIWNSRRVA